MSRMVAFVAAGVLAAGTAAGQGAGQEAGHTQDLLFQAEAQVLGGTCRGQAVRLEGNHNMVALAGTCGSLLVKGVANTIRLVIAPGGSIRVEGQANRVTFTDEGAPPAIVALGPDNVVASAGPVAGSPGPGSSDTPAARPVGPRQAAPAPAPAPGSTLTLTGDDRETLADCAGQDVAITGSRSAYVIRGGCRSLTVRGDLLTVRVEVAPGARISVAGRGSIVSWGVRGHGRPPATIVRGDGSLVQREDPAGTR